MKNRVAVVVGVAAFAAAVALGAYFLLFSGSTQNVQPVAQNVLPPPPVAQPAAAVAEQPATTTKRAVAGVSFQYPYPVSWKEDGVEFLLTGVSLGTIKAPANPNVSPPTYPRLHNLESTSSGGYYEIGIDVYALTLKLKVTTDVSYGNQNCLELKLRRVVNEEGDLTPPNTQEFAFPNGCVAMPNSTYANQEVIFVVPETDKEFVITTGGNSNVFFSVKFTPDGKLDVENLSAETQG